jgi:hypothetical protein
VTITGTGLDILHGKQSIPEHLPLPGSLAAKLGAPIHPPMRTTSPPAPPVEKPAPASSIAVQAQPAPATKPAAEPKALAQPVERPSQPSAQLIGGHPNYFWTWRLLHAGFTAIECQAVRGALLEEILDHAIQAAEHGLRIPPAALVGVGESDHERRLARLRELSGPLR